MDRKRARRYLHNLIDTITEDGRIYEHTYLRICGQISFAVICEVITEDEAKKLQEILDRAAFLSGAKK